MATNKIENPTQGDTIIFKETAKDTKGELLEFDMFIEPTASGPPQHVHPNAEEQFEVLSGKVQAKIRDKTYHFEQGDAFTVPSGIAHAWWGEGNEQAQVRVQLRPATQMEDFLRTWYGLAKDGKINDNGLPSIWQLAVTSKEYLNSVHLANPPLFLQKVLWGILSPIAKILGYKSNYPYPSEK
jgi:quercetin dioxygenase-like cupin family protein